MGSYMPSHQANAVDAVYSDDVPYLEESFDALSASQIASFINTPINDDIHGRTLLHVAAWSDNPDLLSVLLNKGADVNVRDIYGWTPLMVCLYKGNIQNAYGLLQKSATFDPESSEASWLLYHAVHLDLIAIVSILLERSTRFGRYSPAQLLNAAVENESFDTTNLLLTRGECDPNVIDSTTGKAAIHIASERNNLPIFKILVEHGADINIKDAEGNTPLAYAVQYESKDIRSDLENREAIWDGEWHVSAKTQSEIKDAKTQNSESLYFVESENADETEDFEGDDEDTEDQMVFPYDEDYLYFYKKDMEDAYWADQIQQSDDSINDDMLKSKNDTCAEDNETA